MKVGPTERIGWSAGGRGGSAAGCRGVAGRRCGAGGAQPERRRPSWSAAATWLGCCALLHLLRALFGDDDVALLLDAGLVVDRFQRIRPGLAGGLAGAGRIELGAVFERVRQRRIGLAVDRDRLVDVLAGIAIGEQARFRRPGTAPCRSSRRRETRRHGGERDREIGAVAGAHADGAEGAGLRPEIAARQAAMALLLPNRLSRKLPGPRARQRHIAARNCSARARSAPSGAGSRGRRRRAAAAQALEAGGDLVEIAAHLLDLVVDRTALRRVGR